DHTISGAYRSSGIGGARDLPMAVSSRERKRVCYRGFVSRPAQLSRTGAEGDRGMIPGLLCVVLLAGTLIDVFKPARESFQPSGKTRLEFLFERKEVVYENLRDLNFDYRAGKYPQQDYESLRASLESEAAAILSEIDLLQRARPI